MEDKTICPYCGGKKRESEPHCWDFICASTYADEKRADIFFKNEDGKSK